MANEKQQLIKVTMFLRAKDGISEEEFHRYWSEIHAPIVVPWLKRHGFIRYEQYHTPSSYRLNLAKEVGLTNTPEFQIPNYDGHVELWMYSTKSFHDARADPYYEEVVKPDEEKFLKAVGATFGYEEVLYDIRNDR